MFSSLASIYLFLKFVFLYSLVRTQIKFEPMKDHWLFLGVLYAAGIAFLSYVFLLSYQTAPDFRAWQIWLGKSFGLAALYFWLLAKFDEGVVFWTLLLLGLLLVWF